MKKAERKSSPLSLLFVSPAGDDIPYRDDIMRSVPWIFGKTQFK
jgi:hypothetical protein